MVNAIEIEGVSTRFGSHVVHDTVSFSVKKGTIVALIGGSGAGKSVLFREMLGLMSPTAGTIRLLGTVINEADEDAIDAVRRRVGVLFQNGALFSALTVRENVAVPLIEQLSLSSDVRNAIVEARIILSGLQLDAADKMPSDLSGGMRKRAALARALALEPELLFLDEPTSGLDPVNARGFDTLTRALCDNLGLTICIITHDVTSVKGIADQVVVLGERKVLANGTYGEVIRNSHPWIKEYFDSDSSVERRGR